MADLIPSSAEVNRSIHQQVERLQWHQHRERNRDLERAIGDILSARMGVPVPTDLWNAMESGTRVLSNLNRERNEERIRELEHAIAAILAARTGVPMPIDLLGAMNRAAEVLSKPVCD